MAATKNEDEEKKKNKNDNGVIDAGVAMSTLETVERFGGANAEYLKGYRGLDNETGKKLAKGLKEISEHKVNPEYANQNIKQQAGYSAEVAVTSKDNAESIINKSKIRFSRSDDLLEYGKNHPIIDRVKVLNGQIIDGSASQMKFVGNRDDLFKKIAQENGKFSRYRGIKLELPSEQYDGAAQYCRDEASRLRLSAEKAAQNGKLEAAEKLRREASNYDQLAANVTDSGLTTDQAIFYREHPKLATALDIAKTSHRAGMDGAKYGAAIGGCISILQNSFSMAQGQKEMKVVVQDIASDTVKAGAIGYGTAYVGAATKGLMQQSSAQVFRSLAKTSAPTLIVSTCLSLTASVKRYVDGDISEAELLIEVGEKGAGILSSGMMATLGQLAIPIPVVGAALGGMIGYTLSSIFYQSVLESAKNVEKSRELLARTRKIQEAARERLLIERDAFRDFISHEIPQLQAATLQLLNSINEDSTSADEIANAINQYAALLGKELEFKSMSEFDDFMGSDKPLVL